MTTIIHRSAKCFVCGHNGMFPNIASTNQFGLPDLDMRPPEMMRSTMNTWVQCCGNCGYCAPSISVGSPNVKSLVNSVEYKSQKADSVIPELANQFLRWSIIAKSTDHIDEAGWASLNAAWECDDKDRGTDARHCRGKAIDLFNGARKQGLSFAEDKKTETVILVDLLRRCGQFKDANTICEKALKHESELNIKKIMLFQIDLIEKKDTHAHCFDEII